MHAGKTVLAVWRAGFYPIKANITRRIELGRWGQAATMRAKSSKLVHPLVHPPLQCFKNPVFSAVFVHGSLLPKLDVASSSLVAPSL
jgi:hypothetical protein